jgi:F-type H+-transporting ATPase subunit delta
MQAASRESYAAGLARLGALEAEPAALSEIADQLLAVGRLLAREPRLRRALADPARSGEDRVALFRDMIGDRIGDGARDLVAALVDGRWSAPSELLEATERLGVDALLASVSRQAPPAARGGKPAKATKAGAKAAATAAPGPGGTLADVEDELFRFGQIVDGDPRLAAALSDSTTPPEQRAELVRSLLSGKAHPVTVRLVELALSGFGGRGFSASLSRLVELAAQRRDRQVAYIMVASPLGESEEQRLGELLTALYRQEISLKITVDPGVVGGMSVRVGHDLYDGTVIRRLNETRSAFARR